MQKMQHRKNAINFLTMAISPDNDDNNDNDDNQGASSQASFEEEQGPLEIPGEFCHI